MTEFVSKLIKHPWAKPVFSGNEIDYATEALRSMWISGGPYVEKFEAELAKQLDVRHAIAVSNGTVAIQLAMLGLGIGPGDEVIIPAYTFVAVANMAIAVGATPIAVDVSPDTWLIDPAAIESAITPKTKGIAPVHLYGNVSDMDEILTIGLKNGIPVIEDAAEAAFSTYNNAAAGTLGTVGTLSFHATKTITTGEGGAVVTNDDGLAEHIRIIRDHGMKERKRYWHEEIGFNFRLTNIQAAIGAAQLETSKGICGKRRQIFQTYKNALREIPGINFQGIRETVNPVLWAMVVRLERGQLSLEDLRSLRDNVISEMDAFGIETRPGFYSLDLLPPYDFPGVPVASELSASVISLPTHLDLSEAEIRDIAAVFEQALSKSNKRL